MLLKKHMRRILLLGLFPLLLNAQSLYRSADIKSAFIFVPLEQTRVLRLDIYLETAFITNAQEYTWARQLMEQIYARFKTRFSNTLLAVGDARDLLPLDARDFLAVRVQTEKGQEERLISVIKELGKTRKLQSPAAQSSAFYLSPQLSCYYSGEERSQPLKEWLRKAFSHLYFQFTGNADWLIFWKGNPLKLSEVALLPPVSDPVKSASCAFFPGRAKITFTLPPADSLEVLAREWFAWAWVNSAPEQQVFFYFPLNRSFTEGYVVLADTNLNENLEVRLKKLATTNRLKKWYYEIYLLRLGDCLRNPEYLARHIFSRGYYLGRWRAPSALIPSRFPGAALAARVNSLIKQLKKAL